MKTIAYLCSQVTLPGSPIRRDDAFEHDRMMAALKPDFEQRGMEIRDVCWDDTEAVWSEYDAAIIGTTWDYWDRHEHFLDTLKRIESQTRLFNSTNLVRWNSNKQYLKELAENGVRLIPTDWIAEPNEVTIANAFDSFGCDELVVKRQVGAGADGQHRLKRGDALPELSLPMMAQPFLPSIQTEGEMSLIFIDGEFCHALIKRAKDGDYRIQSSYGGTEHAIEPDVTDRNTAAKVLSSLGETPLYARVDMLRGDSGELFLMEIELIEPYLFPEQGPELGRRLAAAIEQRLA
jgi:glutathione synthase/RimK-type ligase-like ATP-grasp enzyme